MRMIEGFPNRSIHHTVRENYVDIHKDGNIFL
jgi:hypothetical protein